MKARGFLREADKKEAEAEVFSGPSSLAGETYQSLFDQVGGRAGVRLQDHVIKHAPLPPG